MSMEIFTLSFDFHYSWLTYEVQFHGIQAHNKRYLKAFEKEPFRQAMTAALPSFEIVLS